MVALCSLCCSTGVDAARNGGEELQLRVGTHVVSMLVHRARLVLSVLLKLSLLLLGLRCVESGFRLEHVGVGSRDSPTGRLPPVRHPSRWHHLRHHTASRPFSTTAPGTWWL
jgi:hypothetical protein